MLSHSRMCIGLPLRAISAQHQAASAIIDRYILLTLLASMKTVTQKDIEIQRDRNYHRTPDLAIQNEKEAARFVNEVGFCFLFPQPGVELPNLWEAINGQRREIPHHHHDHNLHLAWRWKDTLPVKKQVFYGKLIRHKPTLVSLQMFSYFYALSDNYGQLEDYLEAYQDGRMTEEAKRVYEVLIARGRSSTGVLRREAGLSSRANASRFDRAIAELQRDLKIAKCGIAEDNRWKYSYVYDLTLQWLPNEAQQGVQIANKEAMRAIIDRYIRMVVVSTAERITQLFDWPIERTKRVIDSMLDEANLEMVNVEGQTGLWVGHAS